jgi:enamine deaminase RidA (YjgF/YER057c/UK114 family)
MPRDSSELDLNTGERSHTPMTDITRLHTSERASKIVVHGGVAYLSGQVAEDPQADIQDQTRSTLGRVDAIGKQSMVLPVAPGHE